MKIAGSYVIIVRVFIESAGMVFEIEEDSGVYIGFNSSSKMKSFILYTARGFLHSCSSKLKNVPVPLDHFPINALTSKVFSFMIKKGKHFSGNVTPLFDSMLVQPTEDEGDTLERQSEPQPIPSPPHPKGSGGNHGGVTDQAKEIKHLKAQITEAKKKGQTCCQYHKLGEECIHEAKRLTGKKS
ncbi:hypothetical protein Tco_1179108 [Tanacetum coccineum]